MSPSSFLAGLGLYAGRLPRPFTLQAHVRDILALIQPTLVIDVGAHEGEYGLSLRSLGYKGAIASYEPLAASADRLKRIAERDDSWSVRQIALGAQGGTAELHITTGTDMVSLHAPNARGMQRFPETMRIVDRKTVQVRTLEAEWVDLPANGPVLLKLDTQGHDMAVLEGAEPVLDQIAVIQTEVASRPLYNEVPSLAETLTWFESRGYALSGIFPVSRDVDRMTILELDAVFVRESVITRH
jgi:FkbM family methyltransferase